MKRVEYYPILKEKYRDVDVFAEIEHTFRRCEEIFSTHDRILVSVSGGSDSDCIVHIICTYFPEFIEKMHFVFGDTGLEYDATKRHLRDIEDRYNINIDKVRGKSVVWAVRKYGVPILNKYKSHVISDYQRGLEYASRNIFEDGAVRYHAMRFTDRQKDMVRYATQNGIKISDKCCDVSKKKPLQDYAKQYNIDLNITGERLAEGGRRALAHKSCFEEQKNGKHKFMPIWWWSDNIKKIFKEAEGIVYSDCYEVWGMKRTGCVGCPFSLEIKKDLAKMKEFEPRMYTACMNVFGVSYKLMNDFKCHCPADRKGSNNTMYGRTYDKSPHAKKVLCVETGKIYSCIRTAAEDSGAFATAISAVCRGKRNMAGGFSWRYIDETE